VLGKVGRLGRVCIEKSRKVEKGDVSRRNKTVGHKKKLSHTYSYSLAKCLAISVLTLRAAVLSVSLEL
jgi:hypothetical protein